MSEENYKFKVDLTELFIARKNLTDSIISTSATFTHYRTVVADADRQIDKIDTLIATILDGRMIEHAVVSASAADIAGHGADLWPEVKAHL